MTPTIQQAIRIPTDLHEQITAEAQRLGHPHTFSSVAVNAMRAGLGKGPTPPRPKTTKGQS